MVRDKSGKPVGTLRQEDFQLFDKGKPQVISKFSVEKTGGKAIARTSLPEPDRTPEEKAAAAGEPPLIAPDHFVGLLFDDVHMNFEELAITRIAAQKFLEAGVQPADRVAIFTTSGQTTLDFTDDRDRLNQTLLRLAPHSIARANAQECPDISYYQANLIINIHDEQALRAAAQEVMQCMNIPDMRTAIQIAQSRAMTVLQSGEHETQVAMFSIRDIVHRLAIMPGQRTLVLASPGFLRMQDQIQDEESLIDLAIKSNVVVNALDARGLYTNTPDISKHVISLSAELVKQNIDRQAALVQSGVLAELAAGTGGTFVQNSNDLNNGLRELGATPEVYYLLGFSPQNLKLDGAFHNLKISLKAGAGMTVKARLGYYAPRHLSSADEEAKEEISQALFSREEIRDIPVEINTQFFKTSESEARLVVLSKVGFGKLRFRKADGRNVNDVLIVCALFDRNGNYLQTVSTTLKMRLLDATLRNGATEGIAVHSDFKVSPGTYVIRLVVRDAEGQQMAAQNGAVEIP